MRAHRAYGTTVPARFVCRVKHLAAIFGRPGLTTAGTSLQLRLCSRAGIAQLVERNLAKVEVASSSLVSRSNSFKFQIYTSTSCYVL